MKKNPCPIKIFFLHVTVWSLLHRIKYTLMVYIQFYILLFSSDSVTFQVFMTIILTGYLTKTPWLTMSFMVAVLNFSQIYIYICIFMYI